MFDLSTTLNAIEPICIVYHGGLSCVCFHKHATMQLVVKRRECLKISCTLCEQALNPVKRD